ncbi:hypothetical protein ABLE93_20795 [Xanthobacter sp. KR7-65]|uniref:hypothetical protein n=1 Tax=Xanthobacter sp. KR7-65 TaxID=3156612 RepID=UPI0032B5F5F3
MKAIVYWDRRGHDLAPLTDHLAVCLHPIAGRALIALALDLLADLRIRDVAIASWTRDDSVAAALGNGAPWGMELRQLQLNYHTNEVDVWLEGTQDDVLVVRGDALISPVLEAFIARTGDLSGSFIHGLLDGHPVLALARPWADGSWHFPVEPFGGRDRPSPVARSVTLDGDASLMESLAAYHAAHLRVVRGQFAGRKPFGREQDHAVVGARARIAASVQARGSAHVGAGSALREGVVLDGSVAIGERSVIDADTTISDSVILPDTYVGRHLRLRNAIVAGNILIRVDTGAVLRLEDDFILAPLRPKS